MFSPADAATVAVPRTGQLCPGASKGFLQLAGSGSLAWAILGEPYFEQGGVLGEERSCWSQLPLMADIDIWSMSLVPEFHSGKKLFFRLQRHCHSAAQHCHYKSRVLPCRRYQFEAPCCLRPREAQNHRQKFYNDERQSNFAAIVSVVEADLASQIPTTNTIVCADSTSWVRTSRE